MSGVQDSQDGRVLLLASSDEGGDLLSIRFTQKSVGVGSLLVPCSF